MCKITVRVYLKGGVVFEYDILGPSEEEVAAEGREHLGKIAAEGYRHNAGGDDGLCWYPPHWIDKIRLVGRISTLYPDRPSGT